jgi:hypothetical protein
MTQFIEKIIHTTQKEWRLILFTILIILGLTFIIYRISNNRLDLPELGAIFSVLVIAFISLLGLWHLIRDESPPKWLFSLVIIAAILRISLGLLWFNALPVWGHGTPAEKAGYIMADASARDQAAWNLAQSNKSLWKAFRNNRTVDQYGGMLFLSAAIYRGLGTHQHNPIQMVVLCAAFSSSTIFFLWGFAKRAWDKDVANLAAMLIAFYPEAMLLGSSQMREAFTIPLTSAAFYGLIRYQQRRDLKSVSMIIVSLLLFIPFSPPFAALLMGILVITAIASSIRFANDLTKKSTFWIIFSILFILILAGVWITLKQFTPEGMNNPIHMINWWLRKSASLQAYLSKHASGWIQEIFKNTPTWTHMPMLLAYGVVQPFLPAAIVVGSHAPIWRWITLWRSIGWSFMLIFLVYAPVLTLRKKDNNIRLVRILLLIVWFIILLAAFRGGSDMWDNPRYRATFSSLQVVLVAWTLIELRRSSDPWFWRAIIVGVAIMGWFIPWYLQRYYSIGWQISDPFRTLGLGISTSILFCIWDWARMKGKRKHIN